MRRRSPEFLNLLADRTPGVAQLALALRVLVLTEAPEAEELLPSIRRSYRLQAPHSQTRCFLICRWVLPSREPGILSGRRIA